MHLQLAQKTWKSLLTPEDIALDATCGNGYDTLFLTGCCSVVGIDIQEKAVEQTKNLLMQHGKTGQILLLSHEYIDQLPLPKAPRLIVYNLGYLPKGDKSLTTQVSTTLISVKKSLEILAPNGALSITCYPGHEEGEREEKALEAWVETLPSHRWQVIHHKWPNRRKAPSWLWISAMM